MNALKILLLLSSFPLSTFSQVDLRAGLIACYPFNGNVYDASGKNNHGINRGAVLTKDRFGNENNAIEFNGNSFIEVEGASFRNNQYTFSIWAYLLEMPGFDQYHYAISLGGYGGDQSIDVSNTANGATGWTYGTYLMTQPAQVSFVEAGILPNLNEWYHLAGVRDASAIKFYVNGQLIGSTATNGLLPNFGTNTVLTFGRRAQGGQFMKGKVDDIKIYNRALNEKEVMTLFKDDFAPIPLAISLSADKPSYCSGDKIIVTADGGPGNLEYQWKINGQTAGNKSAKNHIEYLLPEDQSINDLNVHVEISDPSVCFSSQSITIEKNFTIKNCGIDEQKVRIPNAFSPNGDHFNDTWEIFNLDSGTEIAVEVFNRWGEVIFYSQDNKIPWDGTYKAIKVQNGVYPYRVKAGLNIYRGVVSVIR